MISRPKRIYSRSAFSLVDTMLSTAVLITAIVGTSAYRYYALLEVRSCDARVTAARVGLLLFESWRGTNGADTYDPTACFGSELVITKAIGPKGPEDFDSLASYKVVLDDMDYYVTLSRKDVQVGLKALNIVVAWQQRGRLTDNVEDTDKLFKLTGYAMN